MKEYTITLTDAEVKAMEWATLSVHDWIQHAASNKARKAIDAIYQEEVERMTNDPDIESIPANKEQVVLDADIMSAADRQAQAESEML